MPNIVQPLTPQRVNVALADLVPNEWNPNRHDERTYAALGESIADHGDIDPILARPHPNLPGKYEIIDGEHRWRALAERGYTQTAVDVVQATTPQAKKLTIILNETRGEPDRVDLAALLADIAPDYGDTLGSGLPWEQDELNEWLELSKVDWAATAPHASLDALSGTEAPARDTNTSAGTSADDSDNDEYGEFRTFLVRLQLDQLAIVRQALERIRAESDDTEMTDARALELLAADYLAS